MRFGRLASLLVIALNVAGCSIHPLPENVGPRIDTNAIVFHIRCEARDAVINAIGLYLTTSKLDRQIGLKLIKDPSTIADVKLSDLSPPARDNIEKYIPAAIAFDFTFDMSEDNDLSPQVDLLDTFSHSMLGLGLKAESDHQRQTIRNFQTSNTFDDLLHLSFCGASQQPNWDYPITGKIGLAEMITTFVDLNEHEGLTGSASQAAVHELADTLVFQTNISGSAVPKLTLNPLKAGAQLSDASMTGVAFRKDNHKVIVALSLSPTKPGAIKIHPGLFLGSATGAPKDVFGRTPAQNSAYKLIDDQVQRNIINNLARSSQ